jgi:hypothetical protein
MHEDSYNAGDNHLSIAKESLNYLLQDKRVPLQVRESLQVDFQQVEKMLEKIEHEHIHMRKGAYTLLIHRVLMK